VANFLDPLGGEKPPKEAGLQEPVSITLPQVINHKISYKDSRKGGDVAPNKVHIPLKTEIAEKKEDEIFRNR
jgi:hypothetical protein